MKLKNYGECRICDIDYFRKVMRTVNDSVSAGRYTGEDSFYGGIVERCTFPTYLNRRWDTPQARAEYDDDFIARFDDRYEVCWLVGSDMRVMPNKENSGGIIYHCAAFCMVMRTDEPSAVINHMLTFSIDGIDILHTPDSEGYERFDLMSGEEKCGAVTIYMPAPDCVAMFCIVNAGMTENDTRHVTEILDRVDAQHLDESHKTRKITRARVSVRAVIDEIDRLTAGLDRWLA